mmetsp:Transcript_18578/g.57702  ORF Transcript_18578/g.57702 Transcript_18578/m.57702 type:complete len:271 (+) Transcript_18578:826-1638(+)
MGRSCRPIWSLRLRMLARVSPRLPPPRSRRPSPLWRSPAPPLSPWRRSPRLPLLRCNRTKVKSLTYANANDTSTPSQSLLRDGVQRLFRVRRGADSGGLAGADDVVALEPVLFALVKLPQDLRHARRVAVLRVERRAADVRRHGGGQAGVAPGMIGGSGLREPYIACVAAQLAAAQRLHDSILIAHASAGGINQVRAALHLGDQVSAEEAVGLRCERAIDEDKVAVRQHIRDLFEVVCALAQPELVLLDRRQPRALRVHEVRDVEWREPV